MQNLSQNKSSCMTITTFNNIYDICKAMKMDYYIIRYSNDNISVYGIDNTFSYISYYPFENMPIDSEIVQFITSKEAISNLTMLLSTPSEYLYVGDEYITNSSKNDFLYINNRVIGYRDKAEALKVIDTFMNIVSTSSPNFVYPSINDDEAIQRMTSCKVVDNIIPYIKDNHYMIIYKGIIPTAKSDKIGLFIYDINDNTNRFVAVFTLLKKKKLYNYIFMYKNII